MKAAIAALALAASLAHAAPAGARVFVVDSTNDTNDSFPGDGLCRDAAQRCSLRAAVEEANRFADADEIRLPAGVYHVFSPLSITTEMSITGAAQPFAGSIIDASSTGRVMSVALFLNFDGPRYRVFLRNLTLRGGLVEADGRRACDGAGLQVLARTAVTLADSVVESNRAVAPFFFLGCASGGGICNLGELEVRNSIIRDNEANVGGGIDSTSGETTVLRNVRIVGNRAVDSLFACDGRAGGLYLGGSIVRVLDSLVRGNTAGSAAGGVLLDGGIARIDRTAILDNESARAGGILNLGGSLVLTNSTVAGNSTDATGLGGSAIYTEGTAVAAAETTITSSTIVENADASGGAAVLSAGGGVVGPAVVTFKSSIIASNVGSPGCVALDESAQHRSAGHNVASDASCGLSADGDVEGVDPRLEPAAETGGPGPTYGLLADSPALDRVPPERCTAAGGGALSVDQRGAGRPVNGACDSGAFERTICGDGLSGGPEQCDDGPANGTGCCRADCLARPPDPACEDGWTSGLISIRELPGKERWTFQLRRGPALPAASFGDPRSAGGTAYGLCLYDQDGTLVSASTVDRAGDACGSRPCWRGLGAKAPGTEGYLYKDPKTSAAGIKQMRLRARGSRSDIDILGQNDAVRGRVALPTGVAGRLAFAESATLQIVRSDSGQCFSLTADRIRKRTSAEFKATRP